MHNLLIVTMRKERAGNSKDARVYAYKWLVGNKLACVNGTCPGMADWFVIGGRWSGILTAYHLNQEQLGKFEDEFGKEYGWWTGKEATEHQRLQQSIELFEKYFSEFKGLHPYWRNSCHLMGNEDDAMICDKVIFDMLVRKTFGCNEHFCDIESENKCEQGKFIDKKWVVVVDYHY